MVGAVLTARGTGCRLESHKRKGRACETYGGRKWELAEVLIASVYPVIREHGDLSAK